MVGSCYAISLLTKCEMTKSPAQTTRDGSNLSPVIWKILGQTVILTAQNTKVTRQELHAGRWTKKCAVFLTL